MKKFDRGKVARIDCPTCRGQGFVRGQEGEEPCSNCGGVGMLEEIVQELPRDNSSEELQNIFPDVENPTNRFDPDSIKG